MMNDKDVKDYHKMVDTLTKQSKAIKLNDKYKYQTGKQITDPDTGKRVYEISSYRLPSVTTILGATKNQEFLTKWKAKVGEAEAERIKNVSSARGTSMHKFLESYVTGVGYDDLTELGQAAKPMAKKIIEVGLAPVEEYYGSEVTLHYPGLYAGSTDLVCLHNGMESIVDFKQSNRPKKKEWIEDYYLQIAAYAMAHDYVYGSAIRQGVIMVCTPDLYYQEFRITDHELRGFKHKFLKRLDMYHDLMFDEKEQVTLGDLNVLLTEMTKEKK
jgi:genome maintenance exonuclease 1|tara:strand:- start:377 stop:1189 length:813 start_codon:yes stop_codon:yes gene_type:complete